MILTLIRKFRLPDYTIGKLYINNAYFCDTIEDTDRGLTDEMSVEEIESKKVYGKTAIPIGRYLVHMGVYSPKFGSNQFYQEVCKGYLPRLQNVKGFESILIHCGNTADESLGCILVGQNKEKGKVLHSRDTFKKLYKVLETAEDSEERIYLEIK